MYLVFRQADQNSMGACLLLARPLVYGLCSSIVSPVRQIELMTDCQIVVKRSQRNAVASSPLVHFPELRASDLSILQSELFQSKVLNMEQLILYRQKNIPTP